MENTIYLGLSRQMTLQTNLNVIANNVANMNTPGYRGQNLLFHEYLSDPKGADDPMSFVYDDGQYQDTEAGSIRFTGNTLDVALAGPGFMGVVGPGGQTAYTRAGNFQLRADGTLITSSGFAVAGAGGAPIVIPADSTEIKIDEKGSVSNQDGQLGQIMMAEFPNIQKLDPMGENMYAAREPGQPAANTRMKQGQLEGANVKPVIEMTRMIDTLRSFQSVQQILQTENDRLKTAIRQLTQGGNA